MSKPIAGLCAWLRHFVEPRRVEVVGPAWSPLGRRLMALHVHHATNGRVWIWR